MKLTDTQMHILAAAVEQQDRVVKPPAIPPGPYGAIEAIGYRITDAGLAAIGAEVSRHADMPPCDRGTSASARRRMTVGPCGR